VRSVNQIIERFWSCSAQTVLRGMVAPTGHESHGIGIDYYIFESLPPNPPPNAGKYGNPCEVADLNFKIPALSWRSRDGESVRIRPALSRHRPSLTTLAPETACCRVILSASPLLPSMGSNK